tara:strand:+ start:6679 stop:7407 length:729 start_codon:yes stop_codon:yes gene_type:complete
MKISNFRTSQNREEIDYQTSVIDNLGNLYTQNENLNQKLLDKISEENNLLIQNDNAHFQEIDSDLEKIKFNISGLQARTERTKIFNQKIDEDILILESPDEQFSLPDNCETIFNPVSALKEKEQFFILQEDIDESHCSERAFNFDTDQKFAIRLDQYSGDSFGYFDAYGYQENPSSDVYIINDTLYKLKFRIDDQQDYVYIEDGFSMAFSDIEIDNVLSFKRDHTISGYTVRYIVEGKMNSE